jgi:NADH dehydrogenase FAD-containing subunit
VEFKTDTKVTQADLAGKSLTTDKGTITYDTLVIATGARVSHGWLQPQAQPRAASCKQAPTEESGAIKEAVDPPRST